MACSQQTNFKYDKDRIPSNWFQAKAFKFYSESSANINQFLIKRVSTVKSLGVHIDENLTWECHQ